MSLNACFGKHKKERGDAAHSSSLPLKKPIFPSGGIFDLSGSSILVPNDTCYDSSGASSGSYACQQASELRDQKAMYEALRAPYAWSRQTDCRALRIAIVDTGADFDHPDLSANLNSSDLLHFNFVTNQAGRSGARDDHGHGSHVAGLIAAVGNNGTGTTGVCWSADIVTAKALGANGSATTSDVIEAMEWALTRDGVRILNASFGISLVGTSASENDYFEDLFSSVTGLAESRGVIIVAAAGNDGVDVDKNRVYPAALSSANIVAVASNLEGQSSPSGVPMEAIYAASNYGGHTVHLSAPGFKILSTLHNSAYGSKTGTSMAAPLVAGSLALAWNYIGVSQIDARSLIDLLLNNVEKHSAKYATPGDYLLTGGKLDLGSLLQAADIYKNP